MLILDDDCKCSLERPMCLNQQNYCLTTSKSGWACTREVGHTGPHISCYLGARAYEYMGARHNLDIWEQANDTKTRPDTIERMLTIEL